MERMMSNKNLASAAILAGALGVAVPTAAVAAEEVSCKVGKQSYVFKAKPGPKITEKNLKRMAERQPDSYTEVEWTYLLKAIPEAKKYAIRCGATAFLKLDDIGKLRLKLGEGDGLKINSAVFGKIP
jgi:hypothetical protein